MPYSPTRRGFFADVGRGMLVATVGQSVAADLGLAAPDDGAAAAIHFGQLEPLVVLMQETPQARLLPTLVGKLKAGVPLRQLVAAAALANARSFAGEDYVGYHTLMALSPAYRMSQELPPTHAPLPVLKVLYRNTTRIHEAGGRAAERLKPVVPVGVDRGRIGAEALRDAVRAKNMDGAERLFAMSAARSPEQAFNDLLMTVQDHTEVHRVVLPYRAWDLLDLVGREQAHTMLRQSVRYCVKAESYGRPKDVDDMRTLLPKLLERHGLLSKQPGTKPADDAWVDQLSMTFFRSTPAQAAEAAAAALAEGFAPDAVGEAISLAANQLVLRDVGRPANQESPGKPIGSIHGDSIGVHASDSANAWRNMARVGNPRNTFACLVLGAFQVALDRAGRGGDFLNWEPLPIKGQVDALKQTDATTLLAAADEAIRGNLQARASAIVQRYANLGHDPCGLFDLMLRYATSEDGSLHAEKYYGTCSEEFARTRPAFRWRHLISLARVTASEANRPAAGQAEARALLGV